MSVTDFPETFFSLTLQCTLLLIVTRGLASLARNSKAADRLWGHCHACILVLCVAAILLPHVRLMQTDDIMTVLHRLTSRDSYDESAFFLFLVWALVALVLSLKTLWSLVQTTSQVRKATRLSKDTRLRSDNILSAATQKLLKVLRVEVIHDENCTMPFCWQLHSPVIVLPEALITFPADELDAVLRHELAHLRSQHPLRLFLQRLVEIVFWFHPLVWMTSREASLQRELASDRLANESASQAAVFLKGMVRLSECCRAETTGLAAGLGFGGSCRSMIQRRVDQLLSLDWSDSLNSGNSYRASVVLICVTILTSTLWIPVNAQATGRTILSPWPDLSASVLHEIGIPVRDYEVDSHRLLEHEHGDE